MLKVQQSADSIAHSVLKSISSEENAANADPNCKCAAYKPLTSRPAPVNKYLGRVLYRKYSRY